MKNYYIGSSRFALSMSAAEAGRLAVVVQFALDTLQSPALREIAQETLTLLTAKSEPTASLVPDEGCRSCGGSMRSGECENGCR